MGADAERATQSRAARERYRTGDEGRCCASAQRDHPTSLSEAIGSNAIDTRRITDSVAEMTDSIAPVRTTLAVHRILLGRSCERENAIRMHPASALQYM